MAGRRRLLDYDPETREQTWHHYDHSTGLTTIETVQDAAPFLRVNQAHMNRDTATSGRLNSVSRAQIRKGMWHVACIPNGVQLKIAQERGLPPGWVYMRKYWGEVQRVLNDPEWAYLRTNPGRV